jgi:hypothetical protein
MDLRWSIQCYERKDKKEGLHDVVVVVVFAENSEAALHKATALVSKKFYRVSQIEQLHDHSLTNEMQLTGIKMQKKLLDLVTKGE